MKRIARRIRRSLLHWDITARERRDARSVARALKLSDTPGTIGGKTLSSMLREDSTVIEVGAADGSDSMLLAAICRLGRVYAVECVPESFSSLYARARVRKAIVPICAALSDQAGIRDFWQSSGASAQSGSLLRPTEHLTRHPSVAFCEEDTLQVPVLTLDQVARHCRVQSVDLLWLDVQGSELEVLKGGEQTLLRTRRVYLEASKEPLYEGQAVYEALVHFLEEKGFRIEKEFFPHEWRGEGNVLFVRAVDENGLLDAYRHAMP